MAAETSSSAEHRKHFLSERPAVGGRRACPGVNCGPTQVDQALQIREAHLLHRSPQADSEAQLGEASLPRPQGTESSPGHQNLREQPFVFGFILFM